MTTTMDTAKSIAEHVHRPSAIEPSPPAAEQGLAKAQLGHPAVCAAPPGGEPPLTRRALAKQRTRRQLLDAAKRLFNERGYEAATVRDIAAAAGLSTGAVFASFADKADLFGAVILDHCDALAERLAASDRRDASTEAALLRLFSVTYAFDRDHLPLVQAAIGHSWTGAPGAALRMRGASARARALFDEVLKRGVERGELSRDLDIRLTTEVIWDCFVANYRQAIFESWDVGALETKLADQIKIVLAGWRAAA
jgi:AcrR family transcriptional regulator